jgi:hypothetical protein
MSFRVRNNAHENRPQQSQRQHPHVAPIFPLIAARSFVRRYLTLNLDTRDLPFSMNTRIRAPRSMNVNAASVNQRERLRQLTLNGSEISLNLPPVKVVPSY